MPAVDFRPENQRLRKAVSNLTLDALILKEIVEGKYCAPRGAVRRSTMFVRRSEYPSLVHAR